MNLSMQQLDLRRRAWRWHFIAAFLVVPFVLWQSVTGTIYVWSQAWVDARHPQLRFVETQPERVDLDAQVAAARAQFPGAQLTGIQIAREPRRSTLITFAATGLPAAVFVDPYSGSVLGVLDGEDWPPGWSRKLHGGWPLGDAGSWLLELGACWTIVMVLSGLYLWWPRDGRRLWQALAPRLGRGARIFWRDLHACVAVWFSLLIVVFLFTALPWTSFWGSYVLDPLQAAMHQQAPPAAGFAPVFNRDRPSQHTASLQTMLDQARAAGMVGDLMFYMVDGPQTSAVSVRSVMPKASQERYVMFDRGDASVVGRASWQDFPVVAKTVATGVDIHEGGYFGGIGPWLNTVFAAALAWLSATGFMAWWRRKPAHAVGMPAAARTPWPTWLRVSALAMFVALPLLALSAAVLWLGERAWRQMGSLAGATT